MLKQINLKVTKIKYTGDSIGDDIRISGNAFGKQFVFDKQVKRGESVFPGTEIGGIKTDQDPSLTQKAFGAYLMNDLF